MKRLLIIFFIALIFISCDRYIDSEDPIRSLPVDGPNLTVLNAQLNNGSVQLSWEIVDPMSEVVSFRVYISESEFDDFSLFDSTSNTKITLTGLKINTTYFFYVIPVYTGGVEGEASETVSALLSYLTMGISNNKEYTNNRDVTVNITAPSTTTHMMLSEDSTFVDVSFKFFSFQKSFNISSDDDGLKTIFARLQFSDGSTSGEILSDDIILDTKVRIDSVFFLFSDSTFVSGDTIVFGMDAKEEDGHASIFFPGMNRLELNDNGQEYDNIADDGIYYGWYVVPANFDLFDGVVTANFTDRANNRAAAVTSFKGLNINTPVDPVTLSSYINASSDSIYFNWTNSTASDFVNYRLFKDTLNSVVDTNDIVIYEIFDNSTNNFVYPINTGMNWYRIYVYDRHGSFAGSNTILIEN